MKKHKRCGATSLSWMMAAGVGCLFARCVTAQDVASAAEAAEAQSRTQGGLEEIVVTAQKRAENIQQVPIAITAVTATRLEDIGITNTGDLAQVVPGLTIQSNQGGMQSHLRGVGTTAVGAGTENSVATYVDNVYILSMNAALVQLANIEQIEVLKGPQGTLFGRNATGGVVQIRTRDPKQELGGNVSLRYGNYDTTQAKAYLTGGLTDKVSADISGFASVQGNGWGENLFTGKDVNEQKEYAVRSKWLFEPTDNDQIRFIADYARVTGTTLVSITALPGTTVNYGPGTATAAERAARVGPDGLPTADALAFQSHINSFITSAGASGVAPFAEVGEPYVRQGGFYDLDTFVQPTYRFHTEGASLQWDHDFENMRFTSITAYRESFQKPHWSSVPTVADRADAAWRLKGKQFSQELQLGSAGSADIPWVLGLYYLDGESGYPEFVIRGTTLAPLESLTFHANQTTKSVAAFGQATAPLWSGAHLTGGLRYTVEERGIEGDTVLGVLPPFTFLFGGASSVVTNVTDDDKTFRKLTWRIALDQQITPDVLAYVSYNRGFKSGQYNAIPPSDTTVDPEILDAYEVGLKTSLFGERVRLNIAGFYYDYKDLQVTVFRTTAAILENGAGAEIYGVDLDLSAKVGPYLTLTGGATLLDSEFTSYPQAGFFVPQPASAGGGTVQENRPGGAKGNKLPYAPDVTFNLGANYTVPVGAGEASFNVNYSYSDTWYAGGDNILRQPSYGLLDGSLTYRLPGDQIEIGIWARNITDEKYYVSLTAAANPGGYLNGSVGAPRTYGAMIGYKF